MPRIKKEKSSKIKVKGLFDHITQVTSAKKDNYWNSMSESERKSFSPYMVYRFLSMNMEYVDLINQLQFYNLQPKQVYDVLMDILPKKKVWSKYLKGSPIDTASEYILSDHYELGTRDIKFNLNLLTPDEQQLLIENIKNLYGERYNSSTSKSKKS